MLNTSTAKIPEKATEVAEQPPARRVPCTDWSCRREHEILRTGPVLAGFHVETPQP